MSEPPNAEDGSGVARRRAAATAFELLGHETRLAIVRTLFHAARGDGPDSRTFSTLRERVGTDDSGRFNYHLGRLRGDLVRETGDGYRLTAAGLALCRRLPGTGPRGASATTDCRTCGGTV